jgi:homogentisate 1,2-dioxygenase
MPEAKVDFVQGMHAVCGAGSPANRDGISIYTYSCNADMQNKAMYNSDGDFLVVLQEGALDVTTEFGKLHVSPGEICIIQRGYFHVTTGSGSLLR